jgi:GntR family transcriptional regulator
MSNFTYSIDKSQAIPLFVQLRSIIRSQIDSGQLEPHDQLPSERELSQMYDISRQTVRLAINELVTQGVLYRQPGKGTYVAPPKVIQDLLHVTSFTKLILDWGKAASVKVISCNREKAPPFVQRLLEVGENQDVVKFERVRLIDTERVAIHRSYIPIEFGELLLKEPAQSFSLIDYINREAGVEITHSEETMEPTIANAYEAKILQIPEGAPLQLITGHLIANNQQPVECHKSLYRGDKFRFSFKGIMNLPTK